MSKQQIGHKETGFPKKKTKKKHSILELKKPKVLAPFQIMSQVTGTNIL